MSFSDFGAPKQSRTTNAVSSSATSSSTIHSATTSTASIGNRPESANGVLAVISDSLLQYQVGS
jgi:hypothetical protein